MPAANINKPIPFRISVGSAAVKNIIPIGIAKDIPIDTGPVSLQFIFVMAPGTSMALPIRPANAAIAMPSIGLNKIARSGTISNPPPKPE